jgi:hypothetical protein
MGNARIYNGDVLSLQRRDAPIFDARLLMVCFYFSS